MDEWWTYRLSDFLLFSPQTFFRQFALYNESIRPLQIVALGIGFYILWTLFRPTVRRLRWSQLLLGVCWLWVAWGYLHGWYATINWAADYLAVGFAAQGVMLVLAARKTPTGAPVRAALSPSIVRALLLFAVIGYPVVALLSGRPWMQAEVFGLMPNPTAMATMALLLTTILPRWVYLPIPLAWCVISGATLWTMDSPDFWIMPATGAIVIGLILFSRRAPASP